MTVTATRPADVGADAAIPGAATMTVTATRPADGDEDGGDQGVISATPGSTAATTPTTTMATTTTIDGDNRNRYNNENDDEDNKNDENEEEEEEQEEEQQQEEEEKEEEHHNEDYSYDDDEPYNYDDDDDWDDDDDDWDDDDDDNDDHAAGSALFGEIGHVEAEIAALEGEPGDKGAQLAAEALEAVEEDLTEAVLRLPPDCDLACLFDNRPDLVGNNASRTETAVLACLRDRNETLGDRDCACEGGAPVAGGAAAPEPGAAAAAGALEEIMRVEDTIEELEDRGGNDTQQEEEALASVEADLMSVTLPGDCNLDCFFENHDWLKDKIEHTHEAILIHYFSQMKKIEKHACECHGEAAVVEEMEHVREEIKELEGQDGEGAALEAQALEKVEAELVAAALPPGCDLECLFDNYRPLFAGNASRTEAVVLDHFRKRNESVPSYACACPGRS